MNMIGRDVFPSIYMPSYISLVKVLSNLYVYFYLFVLHLFLCVCMHMWACTQHDACVKVKGQLSGVGHLFPSLGTRELNVSSALVTSIYWLSHITGSCPSFQIRNFTVAFWETLHILDVLFLFFFESGIWFASVSSQSVACLFILLAQNKRF